MADWRLRFYFPNEQQQTRAVADCQRVLASVVDGPVSTVCGELEGNPREFYSQQITLTATRGQITVELSTSHGLRGEGDPEAHVHDAQLILKGDAYAAKLAVARGLGDAFVTDGWRDRSAEYGAASIIDDADAASDTATATAWRAAMREALLVEVARAPLHFILWSPRFDLESILAAHPDPAHVSKLTLHDCRITALPTAIARFSNLEELSLDDALDPSVLRVLAWPHVRELSFHSSALHRFDKRDLVGFPSLQILSVACSSLESLDLEILDACPQLARVFALRTPLWENAAAMATLRARWPRVMWNGEQVASSSVATTAPIVMPPLDAPPAPPGPPEIDPTWRPFFDAILATPDDDAPRLAFADFLVAHGDKRGEHIRASCELDARHPENPARGHLQAMRQFTFFSETAYPFITMTWNRRGFVDTIECAMNAFVTHANALFADAPIRAYVARQSDPSIADEAERLAHSTALAKLCGLNLSFVDEETRATIMASPHLEQLRELVMNVQLATAADVARLTDALRPLTSLSVLDLRGRIQAPAIDALIALAKTRDLSRLEVRYWLEPSGLITRLWNELGDRVRPPRLPSLSFKDGLLSIESSFYFVEQLRELIATDAYRGATRLSFGRTNRGDELIAVIAPSGAFPLLKELYVSGTRLTDAGVQTLASTAIKLDALEAIDLGGPSWRKEEDGISDGAVDALVRSPRLPALRRITRDMEHHVYNDANATEKDEVVELHRPDGSTVQSIVYHSIWP